MKTMRFTRGLITAVAFLLSANTIADSGDFATEEAGTITAKSVSVTVTPSRNAGMPGQYHVCAYRLIGQWWCNERGVWKYWTPGAAIPVFAYGALVTTTLQILRGLNVTPYLGAVVYAGYGLNADAMLADGTYSVVYTASQPAFQPVLFASALPALYNGSNPLTMISLTEGNQTGATPVGLPFSADSCYGAALNKVTQQVHLSCRFGSDIYSVYPIYDIRSGTLQAGPAIPQQITAYSPVACKDGVCYYGFGQNYDGGSDGKIVVVRNMAVSKIVDTPVSSRSSHTVPQRLQIAGGKLFVLERGPSGAAGYIDVLDISSETFVLSIPVGAEVFDMAVSEGLLSISVRRGVDGQDVLFFNANTGARIGGLTVPGGYTGRWNITGLVLKGESLYIAASPGVRAYTLTVGNGVSSVTSTAGASFATPSFGYELAYSSTLQKLYVTVPNSSLYELNASTMLSTNAWSFWTGAGPMVVVE